jgi:hypothetical protein
MQKPNRNKLGNSALSKKSPDRAVASFEKIVRKMCQRSAAHRLMFMIDLDCTNRAVVPLLSKRAALSPIAVCNGIRASLLPQNQPARANGKGDAGAPTDLHDRCPLWARLRGISQAAATSACHRAASNGSFFNGSEYKMWC